MGEDDWLEAAYEDRNGGELDTATEYDEHICWIDDTLCPECGANSIEGASDDDDC